MPSTSLFPLRIAAAAFSLLVLCGSSVASVIQPNPSTLESDVFSYKGSGSPLSSELDYIVLLLKDPETRNQGKIELSQFIKLNPDHPAALEIAGTLLMEEKDYPLAARSLKRAVELDRRRSTAIAKLGVTFLLLGERERGEKALKHAITVDPGQPLALRYLGWLASASGNANAAIRHYSRLLASPSFPNDRVTGVTVALARLYNQYGRSAETNALVAPLVSADRNSGSELFSEAVYQLCIAQIELRIAEATQSCRQFERAAAPSDPRSTIVRAGLFRVERQYEKAEAEISTMLGSDENPHRVVALHQLARIYFEQDKFDRAFEALNCAADASEGARKLYFLRELAGGLASTGRRAEALRLLREKAADYPEMAEIRYLEAELHAQGGDWVPAMDALRQVIARNGDHAGAHRLMGVLQWKRKRLNEAEDSLRKAVRLDSGMTAAWKDLAGVTSEKSGLADMLDVLREATDKNQNSAGLLKLHADVAYSQGHVAEAGKRYRRLLEMNPSSSDAMLGVALTTVDLNGDLDSAVALARKLVRQSEGKARVFAEDALGWALLRKGSVEEGVELLRDAASREAQDGAILYHLAHAHRSRGETDKATKLFRRAAKADIPRHYLEQIRSLVPD